MLDYMKQVYYECFVTGDLHGDIKGHFIRFQKRCSIQPGDTLIVAGDFGVPWSIDNIKDGGLIRRLLNGLMINHLL